tara:strand:- start:133 stop:417 length:285 start_codon:yes stop_codon:yes gene_type:complete
MATCQKTQEHSLMPLLFICLIYIPFKILIGLLLIINKLTPFIVIVLSPLTISFLIFHLSNNDISKIWPALIVALLKVALLLVYKKNTPLYLNNF